MIVNREIAGFLVDENETILRSLEKINANKKRIVFVVSSSGVVVGRLSDGDVRRWMTNCAEVDLSQSVTAAMNKKVLWQKFDSSLQRIVSDASDGKEVIPLLDDSDRVVAVAFGEAPSLVLAGREISNDSPAFVIAEIGNNHNGDINLAKKLTKLAVDAGADCVKFQLRTMDSLYKKNASSHKSSDLGTEYTLDLLARVQLANSELFEVFDYCKQLGVPPLCTPWDEPSLIALEAYGMEFYKVASADLTNHQLLKKLIATGKPLICSTGMSTDEEIRATHQLLKSAGCQSILLHCNSTYPTPFKDVNLGYLSELKKITDAPVGYSGHERGIHIPLAAVALGAKVIEKHFTIDKDMEGNDHRVSLLPDEFRVMVEQIRELEQAMQGGNRRTLSQGEMLNRENLAKSIIAKSRIKKGEKITRDLLEITSPGQGLQPMYIEKLIGRTATRCIDVGDYFFKSDLEDTVVTPRNYNFSRPFGIPVRYHDYFELKRKSNFDFVEFHLSYSDLDIDLSQVFSGKQDIKFAVHAPELFANDHLLDLTSSDQEYLRHSIAEMDRVCDVTRQLKEYFPTTKRPLIVLNVGGFSENKFLPEEEKIGKYEVLQSSLSQIDSTGVELIIQTMPPFPWHFGGQRFHNLFVNPEEIKSFCSRTGYRLCLDVSHTMMACNYNGWRLRDAVEKVAPFVAHMHIVDAEGVDGEGVQIGNGDVDFSELSELLRKDAKDVMFLPEVWQGHKNSGEGFWLALEYLESKGF